jgi:5-carboxyvanillate decarboxylase
MKIAIEEHCFTQYFIDHMQSRQKYPKMEAVIENGKKVWRWWDSAKEYHTFLPEFILNKLCDLGEGRLKDMDEAGIDMQVLSFNPDIAQLDAADATALTREVNDILYAAVKKHPDRFVSFAALALKAPEAAASELERAVKQLGFKGTMVLSHIEGEFIDAKKYWPVFEKAAALGVPVYIHPIHPSPDRLKMYTGYPQLTGSMWGFSVEGGLTAIRLICSGVFDAYPDLKIILGHLGEALPFWMSRIDDRVQSPADIGMVSSLEIERGADVTRLTQKLKKLPSQYFKDNFFVTTSGMLWQPALFCTQMALGIDKILFAADYPFEPGREAVEFMEALPISNIDKEKLLHLNAERLLGL